MRAFLSLLLLMLLLQAVQAQQKTIDESVSKAVNNYLRYSNEVVFTMGQLAPELEALNLAFNNYVEKNEALSAAAVPARKMLEFDSLYRQIFTENRFLSGEQLAKAIDLIQKTKEVSTKIDDLRIRLDNYIRYREYSADPFLKKGYEMLRHLEVAYFDIYALKEKLYWNLNSLLNSYHDPSNTNAFGDILSQMNLAAQQSKRVMSSLRANDKSSLMREDCRRLRDIITEMRANKSEFFKGNLNKAELALLYDLMANAAENILKIAQEFSSNSGKYSEKPLREAYYYYNLELLPVYNRNSEGISWIYNRALQQCAAKRLSADEVPPIFEIIYPIHPAFDSLRPVAIPDVEKFMEMLEKKRQDSLRADSIKLAESNSMTAFASNNLILLIDISASMNSPEKLPELKKSMDKFLDLLREEDNISIIAYSDRAEILLEKTSAKNKALIMSSLNGLNSKTSSNIDAGLSLSYSTALKSFIAGGNNRIILSTDGNFKIKPELKKLIKKHAKRDIRLSVFYFSDKEFGHVRENLSNAAALGAGNYYFIGSGNAGEALLNEARSVRK